MKLRQRAKDQRLTRPEPACATIASKNGHNMTTDSVTSAIPAKPARLSRTRRTALLKALADPRRYELLEHIAKTNCLGCSQAHAALKIAPATLSHHIKELETAGLIEIERMGKFHNLRLRPGVLETLAETLQSLGSRSCDGR